MNIAFTNTRTKKIALWLAAGIGVALLLLLMGWLTAPAYLKKTIEQQVTEHTGRQLTIDKVTFNPLTLTIDISRLVLYETDKKSPAFSADNLELKASLTSLFRFAPVIREVVLTSPSLQLIRKEQEGKVVTNFSDVIEHIAKRASDDTSIRYSISNIQLENGAIHFDDQIVGKKVEIDAIALTVPFISNFPNAVDTFIEPSLSARVDGNPFELKARSKLFSTTHETSLAMNLSHYDVTKIIAFSPKPLPLKVNSAKFSSNLSLNFSVRDQIAQVTLSGSASLNDVALSDLTDAPLLKAPTININIHEANFTTGNVQLASLEMLEPQIWASLNRRGVLNWLALHTNQSLSSEVTHHTTEQEKSFVELAHFRLKNGTLHWSDAANATPTAAITFAKLNVDSEQISTKPGAHPASVKLTIGQEGQQLVNFVGTVDPMHAVVTGQAAMSDLTVSDYQTYLNRYVAANVSGKLSLNTQLSIQADGLRLNDLSGTLRELKLQALNRSNGGITVKRVAVEKLSLDSQAKQIKASQIRLEQLQGDVIRDPKGGLNLNSFLKNAVRDKKNEASPNTPITRSSKLSKSGKSSDWQVDVNQIALSNGSVNFTDQMKKPAVTFRAEQIEAKLEQVSGKLDRPVKIDVRATVNKVGKLKAQGLATPKSGQLQVDVQDFIVLALQPYFVDLFNVTLTRGVVNTNGKLTWNLQKNEKGAFNYQGNLMFANLTVTDKESGTDFLRWKILKVEGLNFDFDSKKQPTITLGVIDLSDFYARAILSEQGKLNLQNVLAVQKAKEKGKIAGPTTPESKTSPVIKIGKINFKNGVVNYTDNFIKPHYSMRMTGMNGSLGAIQSDIAQSAPIVLNGKIDNDAPIAISGSLNPLFSPILLDVKVTANGIDLPRLTSYSAKYAGYPIEKGKLSLNVEYRVKDNQLTAKNSLKINRLVFGKKVDSPNATKLPILLVTSLLADSNGEINLDLPISGSINDPEFSVGGLVARAFMSAIGKVMIAPFSLLAHSFPSASELSYIEFASGSATLTDEAKTKLDTLAKALAERPRLYLDITGRAEMNADIAGLRARRLSWQIKKMRSAKDDASLADTNISDTPVSDADRNRAIAQMYSDAKFEKPRNKIGFTKSLSTAEMEQLILENTSISEGDLQALAIRRASAVQAYLTDTAKVAVDRMYFIAPKINDPTSNDKNAEKASPSRVEFDLKM